MIKSEDRRSKNMGDIQLFSRGWMTYPPQREGERSGQFSVNLIKRTDNLKAFHKCLSPCVPMELCIPSSSHLAYYMAIVSCVSLPLCCQYLIPQYERDCKVNKYLTLVWNYHLSLISPNRTPPNTEVSFTSYLCLAAYFTVLQFNFLCTRGHSTVPASKDLEEFNVKDLAYHLSIKRSIKMSCQ